MSEATRPLHIAVIGAGIIGACAALELLREGHRVTLIEPGDPGGPQAASHGNGAWLSPSSIVPMSMPGLWRRVPSMLRDPLGPLTIRWSSLPGLLPWLVRFFLAGRSVARVERTARSLSALLNDAPQRHATLAAEAGVADLIARRGLIYVYPDHAAFEAEALAWRLRRDNGILWQELDAEALHAREPVLAERYGFGVLIEAGGHCLDPGGYVAALVSHAEAQGATLLRAAATGFAIIGSRLQAVTTNRGFVGCDRAIISAGIRSRTLARAAGNRVSLAAERGYHVEIADTDVTLNFSLMPADGKMANTSLRQGLRAAGQVELAAIDAPPNWARADVLLKHLKRAYPALDNEATDAKVSRWMGHRPSTPDGLPVIGPASGCTDIVHAFGHGHVGLAAGPITGRLVAEIIAGRTPSVPIGPYSPERF